MTQAFLLQDHDQLLILRLNTTVSLVSNQVHVCLTDAAYRLCSYNWLIIVCNPTIQSQ